MSSYRLTHVVCITAVPISADDTRDKNTRIDSVLRALAGFTPSPIRVGQRAYDDKKKVIRIEFGIHVASDFEAQLEGVRMVEALGPALAAAQYQPTQWSLMNPTAAV